jgi:hypothetical protein
VKTDVGQVDLVLRLSDGTSEKSEIPKRAGTTDKSISTGIKYWVCCIKVKFYQLFTSEERRIPFIFDDFHFCRSRVIGLDMTENRIFTLCRMIT